MTINLPKPYDAQVPVLKALLDDSTRYVVLNASRQSGKTLTAVIASIYWALNGTDEDIMVVSPTDAQVKKINRQTMKMLAPIKNLIVRNSVAQGTGEIEFNNGSIIRYRTSKSKSSLRGYSLSKIIMDECAFIDKETYQLDISPALSKGNNKKVLFCSTPKGKNFFWELYVKGLADSKVYKSFKIHYSQNPYADLQLISQQKKDLHPDFFAQEYEGEFIDGSAVFRNIQELAVIQHYPFPMPGMTYTAGIDIGMLTDFTVITIMNQKNEMVYYDRFTGLEAPELIERLLKTLNSFKPRFVYLERNNQGLPIYNIISRQYNNIYGFDTTPQSKPILISNLINAFSSRSIKTLNDDILKSELQAFTFELTSTGKVRYMAANGFHDDIVMSLALCWKANIENNQSGGYATKVVYGGDDTRIGRGDSSSTSYDKGDSFGLNKWRDSF